MQNRFEVGGTAILKSRLKLDFFGRAFRGLIQPVPKALHDSYDLDLPIC